MCKNKPATAQNKAIQRPSSSNCTICRQMGQPTINLQDAPHPLLAFRMPSVHKASDKTAAPKCMLARTMSTFRMSWSNCQHVASRKSSPSLDVKSSTAPPLPQEHTPGPLSNPMLRGEGSEHLSTLRLANGQLRCIANSWATAGVSPQCPEAKSNPRAKAARLCKVGRATRPDPNRFPAPRSAPPPGRH